MTEQRSEPSATGLYSYERAIIVALVVAQFLVMHGRVWEKLNDLDASILLSYATIPPLVLLALLRRRAFLLRSLLLSTLEIVAIKFVITALIVVGLLIANGGPAPDSERSTARPIKTTPQPPQVVKPIVPSVIPASQRGAIRGRVTGEDNQPVAGALVYVKKGLDQYVFLPPTERIRFENGGNGFSPQLASVMAGQPLELVATDGHLHTFQGWPQSTGTEAATDSAYLFNFPAIAGGGGPIKLAEPYGIVQVHCGTINSAHEQPATIVVLHHPFAALTAQNGTFLISNVPAGDLVLSAVSLDKSSSPALFLSAELPISLHTEKTAEIELTVHGARQ